jgi:hypothetical protein
MPSKTNQNQNLSKMLEFAYLHPAHFEGRTTKREAQDDIYALGILALEVKHPPSLPWVFGWGEGSVGSSSLKRGLCCPCVPLTTTLSPPHPSGRCWCQS